MPRNLPTKPRHSKLRNSSSSRCSVLLAGCNLGSLESEPTESRRGRVPPALPPLLLLKLLLLPPLLLPLPLTSGTAGRLLGHIGACDPAVKLELFTLPLE
jgi:hypothetical protein